MNVDRLLRCSALALLAMGLTLGFTPGYTGNAGDFGGTVSCGTPFFVSDDLSGSGIAACEAVGGMSSRRAGAFALLAGGLILLISTAVQPNTTAKSDTIGDELEEPIEGS